MKFKKTVFKNGLRVILAPMQGTQTVTAVVMVGVGSRYETEKEAGLSHFLEHMFFKGTKKRPKSLAISEELDSIGGESNAFTDKDKTGYFVKVDASHIETALDIVSDIYLNSQIPEKEVEKEKGAILQEINMYEDMPMRKAGEIFEKLLYGENPLGRDVAGYKETIKSFKRKDLVDYQHRFYVANDTVVCVAGNFEEKKVFSLVEKYFSKMPSGNKAWAKKVNELQKNPAVKIKFKKTDQTHLVLGVRAYNQDHPDRFILSVLSVILGGNMSSRLFNEIREKRGLAYYVRTSLETFADCGYLATQAGVEHGKLGKTVGIILKEYKKLAEKPVSARELKRAKDFIAARSIMGLEPSDGVAMFLVDQEVSRKKIMALSEILEQIDKVKSDGIIRVAKNIFRNEKLNLAVIGPHKDFNNSALKFN